MAEGDAEQAVWAQTLPSLRDHVHLVVREYMGQKVCDRTKKRSAELITLPTSSYVVESAA